MGHGDNDDDDDDDDGGPNTQPKPKPNPSEKIHRRFLRPPPQQMTLSPQRPVPPSSLSLLAYANLLVKMTHRSKIAREEREGADWTSIALACLRDRQLHLPLRPKSIPRR
ncbi:Hypothetical predicted protein [Drosophila guanche]|uniref:Uncharacterized protein n=1 Tax=Drosophila guanche TaxID=7266 RepID=A0A3B0J256_DROGU|nr:Hypothetical predicted protein [Drosophila guanche]